MDNLNIPKENIIPSKPYSILPKVYDAMMSHVNYDLWAKYIISLINRQNPPEVVLLDIGCGTANFLHKLHLEGITGDGCDLSLEMLKYAKMKWPELHFFQSSLPELEGVEENRYTVMTCLYDTMNYLNDISMFEAALQSVYRKLRYPGIFIFDLVSEFNSRQFFRSFRENEVIDEQYAYFRESFFNTKSKIQSNRICIFTPEGVFEELHRQRIYNLYSIKRMIQRKTRFSLIGIYDNFTFNSMHRRSTRAHFILRKDNPS